MNRLKLKLSLGAAAAMLLVGNAMAQVKIAYVDPLSGGAATIGEHGLKHIQFLVESINAKGGVLGGQKLEVVAYDNKGSPQESLVQVQKAIDAGAFPATLNPNAAMHMLWASLIGPGIVGIRHRLSSGEDYDALARDVLNATIAGLQAGVATTFVSCKCPEEGIAGAPVPAGVRSHESE